MKVFNAKRPVITATDSGGPVELVQNQNSGFVCEPEPQSVTAAIEKLFDDAGLCGKNGNCWLPIDQRYYLAEDNRKVAVITSASYAIQTYSSAY